MVAQLPSYRLSSPRSGRFFYGLPLTVDGPEAHPTRCIKLVVRTLVRILAKMKCTHPTKLLDGVHCTLEQPSP